MKNDIIKSDRFITEATDLSGNKKGVSISSTDFVRENFAVFKSMPAAHSFAAWNEYSIILGELVKRETIARMQKSIDNISISTY
jgi:hypothetical protein